MQAELGSWHATGNQQRRVHGPGEVHHMSENIRTYELFANQENAGLGTHPDSVVTHIEELLDLTSGLSSPIPHPLIPPSGYGPANSGTGKQDTYIRRVEGVSTQGTLNAFSTADWTDNVWWINSGAQFNGGPPMIQRNVFQSGPFGAWRTAPNQQVRFFGNALAAITGEDPPPVITLHLECGYPRKNQYNGLAHFCEWADVPPNSTAVNEDNLRKIFTQVANAGARFSLGTLSSGEVFVEDCGFAAAAPEGAVYIDAADLGGTNPDSIPTNQGNNQASNFRFHPSVFLRRTAYYRGLSAPYRDPVPFNDTGVIQPFNIIVVSEIGTSDWLLILDGRAILVRLTHPGPDLRRPRDIWNQVWVPLLAGSQATERAVGLELFPPAGGIGPTGPNQLISRLRFLEYARCLPLPGVPTTQQGGPS